MKESIQRDVAAILGSIKSISGRTEETFMNSEWGNNIGIMDSYRKSKKDSFEDITVLKTIIDLLESMERTPFLMKTKEKAFRRFERN